ncbi:NAD(P)H-binding protein [Pseudonocardia sp. CA-107938]|uniref:NAD(P)H-binding protein n=1 Tax=Pseudonocardia sp. CA-107938 TaxID=3240021 RepID=UPI003D94A953
MILVTGANGPFGSAIVEELLRRMPGEKLAVSVRDPERARGLAARGVDVRTGDFDRPETLAAAYQGASTIFVNGTNYGAAVTGQAHRQLTAAIRAAEQAGAERIVITSWQDLDHCPLAYAEPYRAVEDAARSAFAGATILRMTWGMAASVARDVHDAIRTGTLRAPAADATIAPAAVADLAVAAATVLVDAGHEGRTYDLTGPDLIGWGDLAALAGPAVHYVAATDDEFRAHVVQHGFPAAAVDMLIDLYAAFRAGWGSHTSTDLATLLPTAPTPSIEAVRAAL